MTKYTEKRRLYLQAYKRQYYKDHPQKRLQHRINEAVSLLKRNGYTVAKDGEAK